MQSAPNPARDAHSILLIAAAFGIAGILLLFVGSRVSDFDTAHAILAGGILALCGTAVSLAWAFTKVAPVIPPKLAAMFQFEVTRRLVLCHVLLAFAVTALLHAVFYDLALSEAQFQFSQSQSRGAYSVNVPVDPALPRKATLYIHPSSGAQRLRINVHTKPDEGPRWDWYGHLTVQRTRELSLAHVAGKGFTPERIQAILSPTRPAAFKPATVANVEELAGLLKKYPQVSLSSYYDFVLDEVFFGVLRNKPLIQSLTYYEEKPFNYAVSGDTLWLDDTREYWMLQPALTVQMSHLNPLSRGGYDNRFRPFRTLHGYLLTFFLASLLTLAPFHYIALRKTATTPLPSAPL